MTDKNIIGLVIPPVSDCFMPTLGAAQIVSFLKDNKISSKLYDLSAELNHINTVCCSHIPKQYNSLLKNESTPFYKLVSTYNLMAAISSCCISTDNFDCKINWKDIFDLKNYINNSNTLIYKLLTELPSLQELSGLSYVGFSISYDSQLVPSIMLANILKKMSSEIKIIFGGSFFYNYFQEFFNVFYNVDIIDYVIVGRGEEIVKDIVTLNIDEIEKCRKYLCNRLGERMYINTISSPDSSVVYNPCFDDINFNYYPTQAKAFPYMIRSSCYYGKCKFCNGDRLASNEIKKDILLSFRNIILMSKKINISNVYIVDAALSPTDLKKISDLKMGGHINWIANARFDKPLADKMFMKKLYANGCKMLRFGLESGSQTVLNLMNKGTNLETAHKVLKYAYEANIQNHVYIMLGYPGETELNREETLDFLKNNKKYITSYSISFFQPIPNTPIYEELKKCLPPNCSDDYSAMIDIIYKDGEYYQNIVDVAEEIKVILKEYSKTNSEYYSANIFSVKSQNDHKITIHSEYIYDKPLPISVDNNITIKVNTSEICEEFYIYDMYNNLCLKLIVPTYIKKILLASKENDTSFNIADYKDNRLLLSLLQILAEHTHFIENYPSMQNELLHEDITINVISGCKLKNLCIQFSPDSMVVKE